jgi:hypothetical protein
MIHENDGLLGSVLLQSGGPEHCSEKQHMDQLPGGRSQQMDGGDERFVLEVLEKALVGQSTC